MSTPPSGPTPADIVRREWAACDPSRPPDLETILASLPKDLDAGVRALQIDAVIADAEERWSRGLPARLEHYRATVPELSRDAELVRALLMLECSGRTGDSPAVLAADLKTRLPDVADEIDAVVELVELMRSAQGEEPAEGIGAGSVLGPYRLVEWLGAGSFGEVWSAWDTRLERYIALKLLILPAATSDGLDRVLAEAQAAAALDHENIVKVHAAGRLPGGQCYIDCQLVGDPEPLPEDRKRVKVGKTLSALLASENSSFRAMPPRSAARTMEAVARGVAAAHARGIVHRDIKPSNILVTASGRPLVTDFGLSIAAPLGLGAGDASPTSTVSVRTRTGRVTGTPAFMSPEQAEGKPALPTSDVYSLGATLRFLLTGKLPLEASGKYHADARWDVVEQLRRRELPPLSRVAPDLPRDLSAICDKAMAASPEARYVSAQQMAEDLAAWLGHRPTMARPCGVGRRGALWARRNAPVAVVGGCAALLLAGGVIQYVVSVGRERDRAVQAEKATALQLAETQRARAVSDSVNSFLEGVLSAADPGLLGRDVKVLDAVRFSEEAIGTRFKGQPIVEAKVRDTLGTTYRLLGDYDRARAQLRAALEIQSRELGASHRDTLWTRHALLIVNGDQGLTELDLKDYRDLVKEMASALGPDDSLTMASKIDLGIMLSQNHLFGEAVAVQQSVVDAAGRGAEIDIENLFKARVDLAQNRFFLERDHGPALEALTQVVRELESTFGAEHPTTLNVSSILGSLLTSAGKFDEAEKTLRKTLAGFKHKLPAGHDLIFGTAQGIATVMLRTGRHEEALAILEPEFEPFLSRADHDTFHLAGAWEVVGSCRLKLGQYDEAEKALLKSRDEYVRMTGNEANTVVRRVSALLAQLYTEMNRPEDAARERARSGGN